MNVQIIYMLQNQLVVLQKINVFVLNMNLMHIHIVVYLVDIVVLMKQVLII